VLPEEGRILGASVPDTVKKAARLFPEVGGAFAVFCHMKDLFPDFLHDRADQSRLGGKITVDAADGNITRAREIADIQSPDAFFRGEPEARVQEFFPGSGVVIHKVIPFNMNYVQYSAFCRFVKKNAI